MTPRQHRVQDLIRARIALDQQIDKLTRRGYPPPPTAKLRKARTGSLPSPHGPDVGWTEQARLNRIALDEIYGAGYRHITHMPGTGVML